LKRIVPQAILLGLGLTSACGGCAPAALPPVTPAPRPLPEQRCFAGSEPQTYYRSGDPALDALQAYFRPVLEANRSEFTGATGTVKGFGAGTLYPQIWLRDNATLIPATRYLFPLELLRSWLEEHLSHQKPNGELWDWVAAGEPSLFQAVAPRAHLAYRSGDSVLSADKNTTAADQESSAVDAAWQVFSLTGDRAWLTKPISGLRLLDRLDAALGYLLRERLDEGHGLITSAFTADWGDVSPTHADQSAIYLDDETPVVVGLYANALFARAAEELGAMHAAAGDPRRTGEWRQTAQSIRSRLNRHLWQEERGFYRIHRVVVARGEAGRFDDSDIFAMGGNALAVLHDVADERQTGRIVAVAEARRQQFGLSSVAGVLLPPYPTGFFSHPILRETFTYQNGGQWDWWSGRLLLAMFHRGYSRAAQLQLLEVARRVGRSGGLYEWYTREGVAQGSNNYAGNVGALAAAIYQGLFGLDSRADGLDVTIRLGAASGGVRTCEPALGRQVSYEYRYELENRRALLRLDTNAPGNGRLWLRVPGDEEVAAVLLDGAAVAFDEERVGEDRQIRLMTDWVHHELELRMR
jgi:hypothetical protein